MIGIDKVNSQKLKKLWFDSDDAGSGKSKSRPNTDGSQISSFNRAFTTEQLGRHDRNSR